MLELEIKITITNFLLCALCCVLVSYKELTLNLPLFTFLTLNSFITHGINKKKALVCLSVVLRFLFLTFDNQHNKMIIHRYFGINKCTYTFKSKLNSMLFEF